MLDTAYQKGLECRKPEYWSDGVLETYLLQGDEQEFGLSPQRRGAWSLIKDTRISWNSGPGCGENRTVYYRKRSRYSGM